MVLTTSEQRPRRGRPPHPDRANIIADAAVRVLAEEGTKGLSHRRVDREAGLPIGSTVHAASTRKDLLLMAARRLNEMTMADQAAFNAAIEAKTEPLTPEVLATEMMALWRDLLQDDQFYRLRAEMSVLFSQEFRGNVLDIYKPQLDALGEFWTWAFERLGCPNPAAAAMEFSLWNRGVFSILAACEGNLNADHHSIIQKWVVDMIKRLVDADEAQQIPKVYELMRA